MPVLRYGLAGDRVGTSRRQDPQEGCGVMRVLMGVFYVIATVAIVLSLVRLGQVLGWWL
jgi:hypothetical protein